MIRILIAAALVIVCAIALTGCSTLTGNIPSFQYCQHVSYERDGNTITIEAKCSAPIGGDSVLR